jgi:hypothetical protein
MMGGGMGRRQQGEAQGQRPEPDSQRMAEMQARMKAATALKIKGKVPIAPERIGQAQSAQGPMTLFLFPRTAPISAEDKEISFETSMGPMNVKTKFNLKDMQYEGKLSL